MKKYETVHLAGIRQPSPISYSPWLDIAMDFIDGLPLSNGMSVILTVVDRLTKFGNEVFVMRFF